MDTKAALTWTNVTTSPLEDAIDYTPSVWIFVGPFLLVLGSVGNFLTIVVITCRRTLRSSPWAVYLVLLAIADLSVLYTGLLGNIILATLGINVFTISDLTCKFGCFFTFYAEQVESWILVQLSIERLFAVYWPLTYSTFYTRSKAGLGVAISALVLMFPNLHWFWMYGLEVSSLASNNKTCRAIDVKYHDFVLGVWSWVDLILCSLLPFILMLVINLAIIIQVKCKLHDSLRSSSQMNNMTLTLIIVTFTFFLLTAPLALYTAMHPDVVNVVLKDTFQIMNYSNYAINFLLYCMTAPKFRKELVALWSKKVYPEAISLEP